MDRISDEELQNFTSLFNKIMEEGGVKRPDKLWSILQELKERREQSDWIKSADQLPQNGQFVLAYCYIDRPTYGLVEYTDFGEGLTCWSDPNTGNTFPVGMFTHWKPIDKPKDGEDHQKDVRDYALKTIAEQEKKTRTITTGWKYASPFSTAIFENPVCGKSIRVKVFSKKSTVEKDEAAKKTGEFEYKNSPKFIMLNTYCELVRYIRLEIELEGD